MKWKYRKVLSSRENALIMLEIAAKCSNYAKKWGLCLFFWIMLFEADYAKNYASILYQCLVLIQILFWFTHIDFFFTLFTKSVGFVSFFSPMQHSHIHTVFKHYHEQDAMIEKQKFVQCNHWLLKIGEKRRMKWKKKWVVRLLTMEKAW